MPRRLFRLCSALSLLLFLVVCVLWVRSYAAPPAGIDVDTGAARHRVSLGRGRLVVSGPPAGSPAGESKARDLVAGLRNDDVRWQKSMVTLTMGDGRPSRLMGAVFQPQPVHGRPAWELWFMPQADARRALLQALDDPDRFVAAHVLLARKQFPPAPGTIVPPGEREFTHHSLRIGFPAGEITPEEDMKFLQAPEIDPAQLPAIRESWCRLTDVQRAAVPLWPFAAAGLVLPAAWCRATWRRHRRRRSGRCLACGYDLRASPDRCPECGATAAA